MTDASTTSFNRALQATLEFEGVFSDHDWDPGGKTKYGITERVWEAFCAERGDKHKPIEKITAEDAKKVYYMEFWRAPGFHKIEDQFIAAELFDTGVNCGTVNAIRMLQEAINFLRFPGQDQIAVDGKLGPVTRTSVQRLVKNGYRLNLLRAMNGEQYHYYKKIGNQNAARGWTNRLAVASGVM